VSSQVPNSGERSAAGSHPDAEVLKLTVAYDGTGFWGSQRQASARTVQAELEAALERLAGTPVAVELAGRTDRGVHAVGQVARCRDIRPAMSDPDLARALNHLLPDDVSVSGARRVAAGFHPRYDATWREYRYRIWVGGKQPLAGRYAWIRRADLDSGAMSRAAALMEGTHDLASFTGGGEGVPWSDRAAAKRGTVRTIHRCGVRGVPSWWGTIPGSGYGLELRVVADGFLPQLVRTITGALVTVGTGQQPPEWVAALLGIADRRQGPVPAPANGLILWRVGYGNDVPDPDPDDTQTVGDTLVHTDHG